MAKRLGTENRRPSRVLMYFYLFFLVMSFIVVGKIYFIQNGWEPNPKFVKEFIPQKHLEKILPREGTIMDHEGRVLAISTPLYNIFMDCCVQKEHYANDKKNGKEKEDKWLAKADALAGGLATGLGYGDNFMAVLTAASAREMTRFINESYPFDRDTMNPAYLGDLLVTSYSSFSRNRRLGQLIGHGNTVKSALNEMTMIAEGYFAAECIKHINEKHNINMPIADMVYDVLYKRANARRKMKELTTLL